MRSFFLTVAAGLFALGLALIGVGRDATGLPYFKVEHALAQSSVPGINARLFGLAPSIPTITYVGHVESSAGTQNTTFTICSTGCSEAGYYVCSWGGYNVGGITVSSYTINSLASSKIIGQTNGSIDNELWGVYTTPSGSLSVTVDKSTTHTNNEDVSCWVITNLASQTPTATATVTTSGAAATLTSVLANGIVIGAIASGGATGATISATGVTLDWSVPATSSTLPIGAGHSSPGVQTNYNVTFTISSSPDLTSVVAASFR